MFVSKNEGAALFGYNDGSDNGQQYQQVSCAVSMLQW